MAEDLSRIDSESKGLRGFVRDLGYELKKELVDKFEIRAGKNNIDVRYEENRPNNFFQLFWLYNASKYDFSGEFSLNKPSGDLEVAINRPPGVVIYIDSNWARFKASPTELRIATNMEDFVTEFFQKKFGESTYTKTNGCLVYRTDLPEEFRLKIQ